MSRDSAPVFPPAGRGLGSRKGAAWLWPADFRPHPAFPLGVFPVGEPEVKSGVTAPALPGARHLLHALGLRPFAQSIEIMDDLLQAHIRGGKAIQMAQR